MPNGYVSNTRLACPNIQPAHPQTISCTILFRRESQTFSPASCLSFAWRIVNAPIFSSCITLPSLIFDPLLFYSFLRVENVANSWSVLRFLWQEKKEKQKERKKNTPFATKKQKTPHTLTRGDDVCRAIFAHFFRFFVFLGKRTEKGPTVKHLPVTVSPE